MRRGRTRARASGFTLLELMVALTIGGLAISAMYTIGATMIRQYHQQQQASNAMTSLRVALNQVKRDVARAGYLSTPSLFPAQFPSPGCGAAAPVAGRLAGVAAWGDNVCGGGSTCTNLNPGASAANSAQGFTADTLLMYGNYETTAEYPNVQRVNATTVSIGRSSHAYQTDFWQWYNGGNPPLPDTFALTRAFAPGRLIRIRTTGNQFHFATVTGVAAEDPATDAQLTFTPAIPAACLASTDGAWVAPVSAIRYYPRNDPNPPVDPPPFGPMAQLVREEVQPGAPATALALTEPSNNAFGYTNTRVVLDYLVSFNLGFVATTANGPNARDTYVPGTDTTAAGIVNVTPELIRAVTIELSARTPEQDPKLPWGNCTGNLLCYQVYDDRPGAARVRTLKAEVFVPNIAFEGY